MHPRQSYGRASDFLGFINWSLYTPKSCEICLVLINLLIKLLATVSFLKDVELVK